MFYFEVSDVIKIQKCSRALYRLFNQEQLRRLVRIGNLDPDLRPAFWINQSPFFSFQNEVREELGETDLFINVYECILSRLITQPINRKVCDEIGRDLPRTFTTSEIFKDEGIKQLRNNLEALAYIIPDVGY